MSLLTWFAAVVVITYAMTGSALFRPVRHFLGIRSWFLLGLVFCPICFGFWVSLVAAYYYPDESTWRFVRAPLLFVGGFLAVQLLNSTWLTSPTYDDELTTIAEKRAERDAPGETDG